MRKIALHSINLFWLLLIVSALLYGVDYLFFGRFAEIGFNFIGNLAFLPVYVLFVTLMIERVLRERDRQALREKMNMVIGVFFSEIGTDLLRTFAHFLADDEELTRRLQVTPQWSAIDFRAAATFLASHQLQVDSRRGDLAGLREFFVSRRDFMLRLLENPNLLEHDEFTELLWAVFHLVEELVARTELTALPLADLDHLAGDLKRAYVHLLREWVTYMEHLKNDYPYLFSLAVRTNPMNPTARPEVY